MSVIEIKNLGKKYIISHQRQKKERYTALRDVMVDGAKKIIRRTYSSLSKKEAKVIEPKKEEFWALRNIDLDIKKGERVGIIGRNGAGKSTLLKILSRITEPTEGYARIRGRVSSLLEVGTGFHPELTGRENIYLNGAVLGMKKSEIESKYDEIVSFAGVERFLDTPVKRYSSGMQVRLAFAVAAHLEPEILLVDEVLAVGDAGFQKKCLGKMDEVSREEGRTVLFVSHNMSAITQLCKKVVLLEDGKIKQIGEPDITVSKYLNSKILNKYKIDLSKYSNRKSTGDIFFKTAWIENKQGEKCQNFSIGDDISIVFIISSGKNYFCENNLFSIKIRRSDGLQLSNVINIDSKYKIGKLNRDTKFSVNFKDIRLYPGKYYISFWAGCFTGAETLDKVEDCLSFNIIDGGKLTTRFLPNNSCILFLTPEWRLE